MPGQAAGSSSETNKDSGTDPFVEVLRKGCKSLRQKHATGSSSEVFKSTKQKLTKQFHPDKAPLDELIPAYTECMQIINDILNVSP